jgi:Domain of unknown function (DUF4145)
MSEETLPDSNDPHGPCPRCGRLSNFAVIGELPLSYDNTMSLRPADGRSSRGYDERVSVLTCQGCHQNVAVVEEAFIGGIRKRDGGKSGSYEWRGIHWWPTPGMAPIDASLPSTVGEAISEGERCLAVKSPRAAVVMFRGALGLIVVDRGSPGAQAKRTLAAQLAQMAADGDLDRTLADWADHVRIIGNAGAHPGSLDPVSIHEAEELSRLIASLVQYLYIMPARVSRARSARP